MKETDFHWLDIFAGNGFEGNQLAVFPEAERLDGSDTQKIALEMNLSETTFVTGSEVYGDGSIGFRTCIFTKEEELPFAGHLTLGTAFVLREMYGGDEVFLPLKAGKTWCNSRRMKRVYLGKWFRMIQRLER